MTVSVGRFRSAARNRRVPLPELRSEPIHWQPGEHVAVIGTTGTGKTYLMSRLVEWRKYVAIFRTKPDDIKFPGFVTARDHETMQGLYNHKVLIAPNPPTFLNQAVVGSKVFDTIWKAGGWTLFIDELFYVHKLHLASYVDMLLTQGRSKHISIVTGMQRPVLVTRFALSEVTHIFAFRLEKRDQKTVAEISTEEFGDLTGRLPRFHFAHYYVPDRSVAVGTADQLERILAPRSEQKGG